MQRLEEALITNVSDGAKPASLVGDVSRSGDEKGSGRKGGAAAV